MSKLGKKLSDAANKTTGAIVKAGARQGRAGFIAANAVCAALIGVYVEMCEDGTNCTDPDHEHVELQMRDQRKAS